MGTIMLAGGLACLCARCRWQWKRLSNRVAPLNANFDANNAARGSGGGDFTPVVAEPAVAAPTNIGRAARTAMPNVRGTGERRDVFDAVVTTCLTIVMPSFVAICGVCILVSSFGLEDAGYYNECSVGL